MTNEPDTTSWAQFLARQLLIAAAEYLPGGKPRVKLKPKPGRLTIKLKPKRNTEAHKPSTTTTDKVSP